MAFFQEGRYRVQIALAQLSEAKSSKNPQIELHLELKAELGKDGEEFDPPRSRFLPVVYLTLTDKTMGTPSDPGWVAQVLKAVGFSGDFDRLAGVEGWEGTAYCSHQKDDKGEVRDRWSIDTAQGPKIKTAEKPTVRKLNGLFGKLFGGTRPPTPPPPPDDPEEPDVKLPRSPGRRREQEEEIPF